jgi:cation:H+ antiporter
LPRKKIRNIFFYILKIEKSFSNLGTNQTLNIYNLLLDISFIVIGFVLLIKGADFLVTGASSVAKRFAISEMAIGLTIVAMGTSMPELVVNVISGNSGYNEVVFGNIIGSNIFNLFLILGVAGVIYPLTVQNDTVWKEIPFSLGITLIFFLLINDNFFSHSEQSGASTIDGIFLFGLFGLFLYYVYRSMKKGENLDVEPIQQISNKKSTIMVIGGIAGLAIGGKLVVDNAIDIAHNFEVSEKMIGLTIIAAGTSLPELATSATAALKKRSDIAVGNVIGSNIFNILFVLAISSMLNPIEFNTVMNYDIYLLIFGTAVLFIFMFTFSSRRLDRRESAFLLFCFVCYMTYIIIRK